MPRKKSKESYRDYTLYKRYKVTDERLLNAYNKGYTILGISKLTGASESAIRQRLFKVLNITRFKRKPIPENLIAEINVKMNELRSIKKLHEIYPFTTYELQNMTIDHMVIKNELPTLIAFELYDMGYSYTNIEHITKIGINQIKGLLFASGRKKKIKKVQEPEERINPYYLRRGKITYSGVSI